MDLLATRIEPYNFWHVKVKGQGHSEVTYSIFDGLVQITRTEEATNVKLHHVIQEGDGYRWLDFGQNRSKV